MNRQNHFCTGVESHRNALVAACFLSFILPLKDPLSPSVSMPQSIRSSPDHGRLRIIWRMFPEAWNHATSAVSQREAELSKAWNTRHPWHSSTLHRKFNPPQAPTHSIPWKDFLPSTTLWWVRMLLNPTTRMHGLNSRTSKEMKRASSLHSSRGTHRE